MTFPEILMFLPNSGPVVSDGLQRCNKCIIENSTRTIHDAAKTTIIYSNINQYGTYTGVAEPEPAAAANFTVEPTPYGHAFLAAYRYRNH
jgi:hypothetical protein